MLLHMIIPLVDKVAKLRYEEIMRLKNIRFLAPVFAGVFFFAYGFATQKPFAASFPIPQEKPLQQVKAVPAPKPAERNGFLTELLFGDTPVADKAIGKKPVPPQEQEKQNQIERADIPKPSVKPVFPKKIAIAPTLSEGDNKIYQEIFSLQKAGEMKQAEKLKNDLENGLLLGHVEAQKLLHPVAHRSSFSELKAWMERYNDHPDAEKIYRLANIRASGAANLKSPDVLSYRGGRYDPEATRSVPDYKGSGEARALYKSLSREVSANLKKERITYAYKRLKQSGLDTKDQHLFNLIKADIASAYFYEAEYKKARKLSFEAWEESGVFVPTAGWVLGLSSWIKKDFRQAAKAFASASDSKYASPWMVSASAYWAARAFTSASQYRKVKTYYQKAATYPRTFYGILATKALGEKLEFHWDIPKLTEDQRDVILKEKAGQRGLALLEAGQVHLAEAELLQVAKKYHNNHDVLRTLLSIAEKQGLARLQMKLGTSLLSPDGKYYDSALYPIMRWVSYDPKTLDPALIHAFIRQESKFNARAENGRSGAAGLMQVLPTTAAYIMKDPSLKTKAGRYRLLDPDYNLTIGHKYLKTLLSLDSVDGDLFFLAVAYNAGPGKLRRWKREYSHTLSDPLLFIESIPASETRAFVERVMSNYWIYKDRLNERTISLKSVVEGNSAGYHHTVNKTFRVAQR